MCVQCVTNTEMLIFSGVGVTSAVNQGTRQVAYSLGLISAEARTEREARIYRENVAFMESLGLDPAVVLGPAPGPIEAPAIAAKTRNSLARLRTPKGATLRRAGAETAAYGI